MRTAFLADNKKFFHHEIISFCLQKATKRLAAGVPSSNKQSIIQLTF
jgi:hypothetical protein